MTLKLFRTYGLMLSDIMIPTLSILSICTLTKIILYRLLILDDPAQDKNSVEETADLLFIVDQVVDNMEQAAERLDNNSSPEGEVFSRTAKEFQSIRLEWEARRGLQHSQTRT